MTKIWTCAIFKFIICVLQIVFVYFNRWGLFFQQCSILWKWSHPSYLWSAVLLCCGFGLPKFCFSSLPYVRTTRGKSFRFLWFFFKIDSLEIVILTAESHRVFCHWEFVKLTKFSQLHSTLHPWGPEKYWDVVEGLGCLLTKRDLAEQLPRSLLAARTEQCLQSHSPSRGAQHTKNPFSSWLSCFPACVHTHIGVDKTVTEMEAPRSGKMWLLIITKIFLLCQGNMNQEDIIY